MNNPNPFIPQGSLLEQKNKKRARVKIAVFTIFAVNLLVLSPLLVVQGCNHAAPISDTTSSTTSTDTSTASNTTSNTPDTNVVAPLTPPGGTSTSVPPAAASNTVMTPPPPPPTPPTPPAPTTTEYTVVKGDSFYTIAKNFHVKIKDIQEANPNVVPTKLKAGQKLQIPASATGGTSTGNPTGTPGMTDTSSGGEMIYVVKPKDTLTKIAKENGTTVKAIRAANNLKSDAIKAGQKLKVPQKAAPVPTPAPEPTPAPVTPTPVTTPGTTTTPGR